MTAEIEDLIGPDCRLLFVGYQPGTVDLPQQARISPGRVIGSTRHC